MLKSAGHGGKTDKICSCPTKVTQIPVRMSDRFLKLQFRKMSKSFASWSLECFILTTQNSKALKCDSEYNRNGRPRQHGLTKLGWPLKFTLGASLGQKRKFLQNGGIESKL